MYINIKLDKQETDALEKGKKEVGIKANADYVRYLIVQASKNESK